MRIAGAEPRESTSRGPEVRSAPPWWESSPLVDLPAFHPRGAGAERLRPPSPRVALRTGRACTSTAIFHRTRSSSRAGRAAASGSTDIARRSSGTRSIRPGWIAPSRTAARAASSRICCSNDGKSRIFRQRFAGSAIATLDWPPAAEIAGQVRIYRPDDRRRSISAGYGVRHGLRTLNANCHVSRKAFVSG